MGYGESFDKCLLNCHPFQPLIYSKGISRSAPSCISAAAAINPPLSRARPATRTYEKSNCLQSGVCHVIWTNLRARPSKVHH
eukprot:4494597-Amphidinium_carterae.1